jgi:Molybdopterin oxidoreductase Fe4S4 domain.
MMTDQVTVFEDHKNQRIEYSTCYMCACRCGIKVTVENDNVRLFRGIVIIPPIRECSVPRAPPAS